MRIAVAPYEDEPALREALQGVERLVLVSGSEVGKRVAQHTSIIEAAVAAGVQLIAYTSLLNLEPARATGKVFGAVGEGRVSGAARKDYAEAAAAVITMEAQEGRVYELAGQPTLSCPELAARIGQIVDREVTYENQTEEQYRSLLQENGLPASVTGFVAGMDRARSP